MAEEKKTTEPDAKPEAPENVQHESLSFTNWEFIGKTPTVADVIELLGALPEVWGVTTLEFGDYVQALPQKKKYKKPHPTNPNLMVEEYADAWTLYMSVGGRQQMLRTAQELHGWRVDYRPEPITPTGVPGYLRFEGRLVYRVYVDIYALSEDVVSTKDDERMRDGREWMLLGTRSGTAWVPETGGSQAAGSNPYEKVETSALGRAIGAWGFGVLPGSGIATVEEMASIAGNSMYQSVEQAKQRNGGGKPRESREELMESTLSTIERYRQEANKTDDEMTEQIAKYLVTKLGIREAYTPETNMLHWTKVKDGQLVMLRQSIEDGIRSLRDAQFGS